MTELDKIYGNKSSTRSRGRPRGLGPRMTHLKSGAYAKDLKKVYEFWKQQSPAIAACVDQRSDSYAQALGCQKDNPRYNRLQELAVMTISRELLLTKILDQDFTRVVRDPKTKKTIRNRASDQFKRLWYLETEIQGLIISLGLQNPESGNNNLNVASYILSPSPHLKKKH